jgi:hypothetical protein
MSIAKNKKIPPTTVGRDFLKLLFFFLAPSDPVARFIAADIPAPRPARIFGNN